MPSSDHIQAYIRKHPSKSDKAVAQKFRIDQSEVNDEQELPALLAQGSRFQGNFLQALFKFEMGVALKFGLPFGTTLYAVAAKKCKQYLNTVRLRPKRRRILEKCLVHDEIKSKPPRFLRKLGNFFPKDTLIKSGVVVE